MDMRLSILALAASAALCGTTDAQAIWSVDPSGSMTQYNGPAAGPCSYPLGPLAAYWSHVTPGFCATPGPVGANGVGGLGMDRQSDELWITDGFTAAGYQTFGTPVVGGVDVASLLGGAVTGLDWDPTLPGLWVTDGTSAASATLTFDGSCYSATSTGSFTLPITGQATALSVDPVTNSLWVVDDLGFLTQVTKTGALGALGSVHAATTTGCGLTGALTGVAADPAGPAGRVYVTDGFTVAVADMSAAGALAPTTFYTGASCFPAISPVSEGLVIAATGNLFGAASPGPLPAIGTNGQSIIPNPSFKIEVAGAMENELAVLVLGSDHLCPSLQVLGIPLHVAPPLVVAASTVIDDTGYASLLLPLGVGTPIGATVFLQWGLIDPLTFLTSATRGLAVTTSLP